MTELYELPNRPAARVAICRVAIEDAMSRGFTLKEIAARLDVKYKTFWQAWREARIVVDLEKQVALPALPAPDKECFRVPDNSSKDSQSNSGEQKQVSKSGILDAPTKPASNRIDLDDPANQG